MAKIDYEHHQREYAKRLEENPKLKVAEYCDEVGLNYGTAKRYISKKAAKAKVSSKIDSASSANKRKGTRHDWHALLKEFLVRATQNPTLSMVEYADEKGVNNATLRRQFKGMRELPEFDQLFDLYDEQKAKYSLVANDKKSKKTGETIPSAAGRKARAEVRLNEIAKKRENSGAKNRSSAQTDLTDSQHSSNVGRPVIHGGYMGAAGLTNELLDILSEIDPLSINNELLLARANYITMQGNIHDRINRLLEMKVTGEPLMDGDEELDIDKAIDRLMYGYAPRLRELEMSITQFTKAENKRYIDLRKQEQAELLMPHVLPAEQQRIIMQMTELRTRNNWTALETCQNIEALGAVPPPALLHEMKVEIANIEPEIDDDGVDDSELDALFDDYEVEPEQQQSWIDDRREEVATAIQLAEDAENGVNQEQNLSPVEIQKEATKQQAYDDLDETVAGFDDIDSFEVLGGEKD
ncbi:hypothetical protein [Vibrio parahaemolyticus]|uniref:hypothetical protein n=1 Tax=Vibrio parahaemolyticus TaxID=670 RepID=UPI003D816F55